MSATEADLMTTVRVVYTVEYEVVEGRLDPPGDEDEAMLYVQAFLDVAPGRSINIAWNDEDETIMEPVGWGVQTDYWGDLWTGIDPPEDPQ